MAMERDSMLVHLLMIALSSVAFGFSIAAERRRSVRTVHRDERTNETCCIYNSDVATGYGVGAFLFLLKVTLLVEEACLIVGASKNAYHTKYREMVHAQKFSCETLRKGVFIAGAILVVATVIHKGNHNSSFSQSKPSKLHS